MESPNLEAAAVGRRSSSFSIHSADSGPETSCGPESQLRKIRALAWLMARMEVTRPEVLRATCAYHAFQSCAAALRGSRGRDFFAKSREVCKIQEFWSHSWHSSAWAKCLTLLVLKNGRAAICVGYSCALIGILLFHLHVLPGLHNHLYLSEDIFERSSVWSSVLGAAGIILTMACWRCKTAVFLDRICISHTSAELKTEAICSLAGILNSSESMLVLWDASFAERLWCVFEIAAFLKSKQGREPPLLICPTLTGPISFAVFAMITIAFIPLLVVPIHEDPETSSLAHAWHLTAFVTTAVAGAYACCHFMRGFYRSVEVMQRQLLCLQIAQLKCSCCSTGRCRGGEVCDKRIIAECIAIWFGSAQDFVEYIRTEVVEVITKQLERNAFNLAWSLAITSPSIWGVFDLMQFHVRTPHPNGYFIMVWFYILLTMLLLCPVLVSWMKFLAYHLRHESRSRCGEVLTNSLMILYMMPVVVFGMGAYAAGAALVVFYNSMVYIIAVVVFLVPGWALMWVLYRRGSGGYLSDFIWQQRLVKEGPDGGKRQVSL
ncbi:unnamed protein product [Effrenium voratum]|nr:unnamed protein product [Effrenium voratum]